MLEYYEVDYDTTICPYCGGPAVHPFTGLCTEENRAQRDAEMESCILMECCDEGGGTTGYTIICRNRNKYDGRVVLD